MSRIVAQLRARHRHPVPDQGGFALIAVLAVIALTGLTIAALMGLMLTSMRVTSAQERVARERRAADGAIENVIQKLRTSTERCATGTQPYLADQRIGGVDVDVDCEPTLESGASASDQVRIVGGDGYNGEFRTWTDDCASNATAGCLPWTAAGVSNSGLQRSQATVVHSGPQPLEFSSGVTVRAGAAALRSPATDSPAIEVSGEYHQGLPGIGGGGGADCGMLAAAGAGRITDLDDSPTCSSALAAALKVDLNTSISGLLADPTVRTVPANCSASPSVVTFLPGTYSPALTEAVSKLTDGSVANCRNKTFHFTPGVYSFQGGQLRFGDAGSYYVFGEAAGWTGSGVQGAPALVADANAQLCNPSASGTSLVLAGWTRITHTAGRVAICPARPVNSVDPDTPLEPHPAIFQQRGVPSDVTVTSVNRTPARNGLSRAFSCRAGSFSTGFDYPVNTDYPLGLSGPCRPRRTYQVNLSTSGSGPVESLRVMLTGTEDENTPNNLIDRRQSRFNVRSSSGASVCLTDWVDGTPNGRLTSSFDIKKINGCAAVEFDQSVLDGGRIDVEHQMDLGLVTVAQSLSVDSVKVDVNAVEGWSDPDDVSGSDWTDVPNVSVADTSTAKPVMPCADFLCASADPGRTRTPSTPFVHEMQLDGFSFPGIDLGPDPDLDPSIRSLRAIVKVTQSSFTLPASWRNAFAGTPLALLIKPQNFLFNSKYFLELRGPDGARCIVQGHGVNSDQELAFDLLGPDHEDPNAADCNTVLFDNMSDLDDVTLTMRIEMPCIPDYLHNVPSQCLRSALYDPNDTNPVWQMRPPDIESVRLSAVTDTYTNATTSRATVNATGGTSVVGRASFNVYGSTWMPLTDLDIYWNGPATSAPLFADDLVLRGLGSRMAATATMGTVCCSPPESRTVELTARIDGVERLVSRVQFTDVEDVAGIPVNRPGFSVDVLRWLNCGPEGCASVLAASDTNPANPP